MASSLPSTQNQILPATPSNYDVYNRNALKSHNYGYKNSEDPECSKKNVIFCIQDHINFKSGACGV